jgi:hypothetical protein
MAVTPASVERAFRQRGRFPSFPSSTGERRIITHGAPAAPSQRDPMRQALTAVPLAFLLACAPGPSAQPAPRSSPSFLIKVTTGQRESVSVDWAIFPDESWPLEGRRDRTPFELELPPGRVAVILRPTVAGRTLEVTLYHRDSDGSLLRLQRSPSLPIAVVVVERGDSIPTVLGPEAAATLGPRP